jgi:hypothetical protein
MLLFSSRGLPSSLRQINSYSGHTYKLTKEVRMYTYTVAIRSSRLARTANTAVVLTQYLHRMGHSST